MWHEYEVVRDRQERLRRQAQEHRLSARARARRAARVPAGRSTRTGQRPTPAAAGTWARLWTLAVGAVRRT